MNWNRRLDWRPDDLGWWIAWLFIAGSILFAVGSFPLYSQTVDPGVVGITFVIGSVCFTAAAGGQMRQASTASGQQRRHAAPAEDLKLEKLAAIVQLAGTLLFNINTIDAMIDGLTTSETNRLVWAPDFFGSIAFLIASHLGWLAISIRSRSAEADLAVNPEADPEANDVERRSALANYVGSGWFMVAAIASFALRTTGEMLNTALVNSATCAGAICFLVGSYLLLPPTVRRTVSAGEPSV